MKKCSSCGKEFAKGTFCPECGGKLEDAVKNTEGTSSTFCPNCGSKMEEGAVFCSNCGWSKNGAKNAGGKAFKNLSGFNKKFLFAIPAVLVVVVLFFIVKSLFGGGGTGTIAKVAGINKVDSIGKGGDAVFNGVNNTFVAITSNEIIDLVTKTFSSGSIEMKMPEMPAGVPVDGKVNTKMYFGENEYALTFDGKINGKEFKDNIVYIDNEKIVAKVPVAFDKKVYGVAWKNLVGSWMLDGLSSSDRRMIESAIENQKNIGKFDKAGLIKDLSKIYKDCIKNFKASVKNNLEFDNEDDTISIGDKDVKVLSVSTKVTTRQAGKVYKDMLKWAKGNKDIKPLLKKYSYLLDTIPYNSYDAESIYDEFVDYIDKELDRVDDNFNSDGSIKLQFYIAKNTKQLVGIKLDEQVEVVGGPDWQNPNYFSFSGGYENVVYNMTNDGNDYTYKISYNGNELGRVNWNKKNGEFAIKDSSGSYSLNGTVKFGSVTNLDLENIKVGMVGVRPHTSFIIKKSDKVPSDPGKFEDVAKMDRSDLEGIVREIGERVVAKFALDSLVGSLW